MGQQGWYRTFATITESSTGQCWGWGGGCGLPEVPPETWRTNGEDGPVGIGWREKPALQTQRTSYLEAQSSRLMRLSENSKSRISASSPLHHDFIALSGSLSLLEDSSKQSEGTRETNKLSVTITQATWRWPDRAVVAMETEKNTLLRKIRERKRRLPVTYVNCLDADVKWRKSRSPGRHPERLFEQLPAISVIKS